MAKEKIAKNADEFVNYPLARQHKIIHAAPQFRPIKRGARRKGIVREYIASNNAKLTISMIWELDIADQDLLVCLLGIANDVYRGAEVKSVTATEKEKELREALKLKRDALDMSSLMIQTTGYELLKELGRCNGGADHKWLRDSLSRLSKVSFDYDGRRSFWSFHLISVSGLKDEETGKVEDVTVMINPLSAQAMLGEGGKESYVMCFRKERHKLVTEEARALHSVLCGLVDMGQWRDLGVDMLADKVYSRYDDVVTPEAAEHRRRAVVSAAMEIDKLGYWSCEVFGRGANKSIKVRRKTRKDFKQD